MRANVQIFTENGLEKTYKSTGWARNFIMRNRRETLVEITEHENIYGKHVVIDLYSGSIIATHSVTVNTDTKRIPLAYFDEPFVDYETDKVKHKLVFNEVTCDDSAVVANILSLINDLREGKCINETTKVLRIFIERAAKGQCN